MSTALCHWLPSAYESIAVSCDRSIGPKRYRQKCLLQFLDRYFYSILIRLYRPRNGRWCKFVRDREDGTSWGEAVRAYINESFHDRAENPARRRGVTESNTVSDLRGGSLARKATRVNSRASTHRYNSVSRVKPPVRLKLQDFHLNVRALIPRSWASTNCGRVSHIWPTVPVRICILSLLKQVQLVP